MKVKFTILLILLVSFVLSTGCTERDGAASVENQESEMVGTVVEVVPEDADIKSGETTQIAVNIRQVENLYGVEVHINFDADRLVVIDADPEEGGVQVMPGHFPQPDFIAQNQVDGTSGTLDYAVAQMPPHEAVNGDGTLFTFDVQGKAPGEADITLIQVLLATSEGEPIETALRSSTLVIEAKP
jgi:hypothetical protein